jgi:hypothetical protein
MGRAWILCKKIFSLALVFNALLTITCAAGIIAGFYWFFPDWQPFYPYLYSGVVFWIVIAAAAINIFPSALLGRKLHTGRFLFHHYFYGFLVLICASFYVITFTPVPLGTIFLINNTSVEVNTGRFFLLGGLTLVLDDLPDVSRKIESGLNWLKTRVLKGPRLLIVAQAITGIGSLYLSAAILYAMMNVPEWITIANFILLFTVLVTGLTSFVFVRKRVWRNIPPTTETANH